ncbi:MAG: NAD(P)-binding domain-containing protein [Hyphomicrobiaceae bacterium]
MVKIAFLGQGKIGSGMAGYLLAASNEVRVWNRSANKVEPLAAKGCTVSTTPADAAEGADVIFSVAADDAASKRVWLAEDGALSTASPGTLAIESIANQDGSAMLQVISNHNGKLPTK